MSRRALRILIAEDQCLVAKQIEVLVQSAGHVVVGTAVTAADACELAASTDPDLALVDISLAANSSGLDVAAYITEHRDCHVVFTTANRRRLPADFGGAVGVVEKPFTRSGLLAAVNFLAAKIRDRCAFSAKPESLQLSPNYRALWQIQ